MTINGTRIVEMIKNADLTAAECSDIFRALLSYQSGVVIGGKMWTAEDINYLIKEEYAQGISLNEQQVDVIFDEVIVNADNFNDCNDKEWSTIIEAIEDSDVAIHVSDIDWDCDVEDNADKLREELEEYLYGLVINDDISRDVEAEILDNFDKWYETAELGDSYLYDGNEYKLDVSEDNPPAEVDIKLSKLRGEASIEDYLTDIYGWCVKSFNVA